MSKKQRVPIEKVLLYTIGGVGVLGVLAVAPGMGPALKLFGFGRKRRYPDRYVKSALGRMKDKGLVRFEERADGTRMVRITEKGRAKLADYEARYAKPRHPRRWDNKWRIVVFDIPESKRVLRNRVRDHLVRFEFVRLQDSVWVSPYPCEELVGLLKADLRIGKNLLYILADHIEYDKPLRARFGLPRR